MVAEMTVRELIEQLQKLDPTGNCKVYLSDEKWLPVIDVYEEPLNDEKVITII